MDVCELTAGPTEQKAHSCLRRKACQATAPSHYKVSSFPQVIRKSCKHTSIYMIMFLVTFYCGNKTHDLGNIKKLGFGQARCLSQFAEAVCVGLGGVALLKEICHWECGFERHPHLFISGRSCLRSKMWDPSWQNNILDINISI